MVKEYIDKGQVHDIIAGQFCACSDEVEETINAIWDEVRALTAADVRENVKAHDTGEERYFKCSECGYGVSDVYEAGPVLVFEDGKEWHFCPNCGAQMGGAEVEGEKTHLDTDILEEAGFEL